VWLRQRKEQMAKTVLVLNGPNINMLGKRQPEVYGHETFADIEANCMNIGASLGLSVICKQSNYEGELITWIQEAREEFDAIVINPAAYSHTSIGILDPLHAFEGAVIEVHISNIHKREEFRHHSYVSLRADGIVVGCGTHGYDLGLRQAAHLLSK
jgi:3-dehydroquinate dehydratase-2